MVLWDSDIPIDSSSFALPSAMGAGEPATIHEPEAETQDPLDRDAYGFKQTEAIEMLEDMGYTHRQALAAIAALEQSGVMHSAALPGVVSAAAEWLLESSESTCEGGRSMTLRSLPEATQSMSTELNSSSSTLPSVPKPSTARCLPSVPQDISSCVDAEPATTNDGSTVTRAVAKETAGAAAASSTRGVARPAPEVVAGTRYKVLSPCVVRASYELDHLRSVQIGVLPEGCIVEPLTALRNETGVLRLQIILEMPEPRIGWVSETAVDGTKLLRPL